MTDDVPDPSPEMTAAIAALDVILAEMGCRAVPAVERGSPEADRLFQQHHETDYAPAECGPHEETDPCPRRPERRESPMIIQHQIPTWRQLPQQQQKFFTGCCCNSCCEDPSAITFSFSVSGITEPASGCSGGGCTNLNYTHCLTYNPANQEGCCSWTDEDAPSPTCFVSGMRLIRIADAVILSTRAFLNALTCLDTLDSIAWGNVGFRPCAAWVYEANLPCSPGEEFEMTLVYANNSSVQCRCGIGEWPGTMLVTSGSAPCS